MLFGDDAGSNNVSTAEQAVMQVSVDRLLETDGVTCIFILDASCKHTC